MRISVVPSEIPWVEVMTSSGGRNDARAAVRRQRYDLQARWWHKTIDPPLTDAERAEAERQCRELFVIQPFKGA